MTQSLMLEQVSSHLFQLFTPFAGLPLYLYVITGSQVVVVDSGVSSTPAEHIFPALDAAKLTPDLLICTHGHVDHFGGNAAMRERYPNLKIAIHQADVSHAEDHLRHLHEMYMCMPESWQYDDGGKEFLNLCGPNCAIDLHLRHGQTLDFGAFSFEVIQTQGHSPGHITLYDRRRGVVICGDAALGWGAIVPAQPLIPPYHYSPDLYLAGVETIRSLKGDFYCTGHFGVLSRVGMDELAERSVDLVKSLEKWSLEALDRREPRSLSTVAHKVGEQMPGGEGMPRGEGMPGYEVGFHLHASVQAHLLKHCGEGRARAVIVHGQKHYLLA